MVCRSKGECPVILSQKQIEEIAAAVKVDYTEQKKLAAAVSRIATNINHVCRRINSTGHFYDADVAELKERMADVWELLKVQQRNEL